MTPDELAKKGTESGEQKALFAWAAMAYLRGFSAACADAEYTIKHTESRFYSDKPAIPELKWLHAVPNGGLRDAVTASRMKAEGVKAGVFDVFWPVSQRALGHCGLYLELKRRSHSKVAAEQTEFQTFVQSQGYAAVIVYGWREAASAIMDYREGRVF